MSRSFEFPTLFGPIKVEVDPHMPKDVIGIRQGDSVHRVPILSEEQDWALRVFQAALNIASNDQRLAMLQAAKSGYCASCGTDDPCCPCDNDE